MCLRCENPVHTNKFIIGIGKIVLCVNLCVFLDLVAIIKQFFIKIKEVFIGYVFVIMHQIRSIARDI